MSNVEVREEALLLGEGRDEEEFFRALLKHCGFSGVQVIEYKGKTKLRTELEAITLISGFDRVRRLAFTRDANGNSQSAFQSVSDVLKKLDLPTPKNPGEYTSKTHPIVGVFILPDNERSGMLEDLCLESVADHPVMTCVDQFMTCLHDELDDSGDASAVGANGRFPKTPAKARAHAFLAGMPALVEQVGLAGQKGYWNFDHACFGDIKAFLKPLSA